MTYFMCVYMTVALLIIIYSTMVLRHKREIMMYHRKPKQYTGAVHYSPQEGAYFAVFVLAAAHRQQHRVISGFHHQHIHSQYPSIHLLHVSHADGNGCQHCPTIRTSRARKCRKLLTSVPGNRKGLGGLLEKEQPSTKLIDY